MNDQELDQLLRSAAVPAPQAPDFQHRVWSRIEMAELAGWRARLGRTMDRVLGFLALPRVAVATCLAMVAAGAWLGTESETTDHRGEVAYVQSISPFAQSHRR